jgi:hypothetical protein
MSRSGYSDDCEYLALWRGVIASATRGKRGQRFFRDLVAALDAMPVKRLVAGEIETTDGEVCALGSLARVRGLALERDDVHYHNILGETFDIAHQLAQEVMFENDEGGPYGDETPERRWERVRKWAGEQIKATP